MKYSNPTEQLREILNFELRLAFEKGKKLPSKHDITDNYFDEQIDTAIQQIEALDTANKGEECDCPCHEPSIYRPHKSGHSCCDRAVVINQPTPEPELIKELPSYLEFTGENLYERVKILYEKLDEVINKLNQKER